MSRVLPLIIRTSLIEVTQNELITLEARISLIRLKYSIIKKIWIKNSLKLEKENVIFVVVLKVILLLLLENKTTKLRKKQILNMDILVLCQTQLGVISVVEETF